MRFASGFAAFILITPALGMPTRAPVTKRAGPVKSNSFIVTFIDTASKDAFVNSSPAFNESGSGISYNYDLVPAAAMTLIGKDVNLVQGVKGVESIDPDAAISLDYEVALDEFDLGAGANATEQVSDNEMGKRAANGAGVTVYGLDTGIYTQHKCFEGRASWGKTFGGYQDADGHGHGTHTAGTAVGKRFGVATRARIVAVKVLSDEGSGYISDIIAGIQWAFNDSRNKGGLAIVTMSLGGSANQALDDAVKSAIHQGLHFTVAAGNSNVDASGTSPARVATANTVGAVDSKRRKASFSNYGQALDIWAPGVGITSAWITSPDSTAVLSGTSMATPYVAGILANVLGNYGAMTPVALSKGLVEHGQSGVTFSSRDAAARKTSTNKFAVGW